MNQEIIPSEFDRKYPNITNWVEDGILEIGGDEWSNSFIRVIDEGGIVWEGKQKYATLNEALRDAEKAIAEWFNENT